MSLENQVFISYFSRTHLIKGEALNGGVEWRVGCGGRGGGWGLLGVLAYMLVNFHRQRTKEVTVWFSCACSHSCVANVCNKISSFNLHFPTHSAPRLLINALFIHG